MAVGGWGDSHAPSRSPARTRRSATDVFGTPEQSWTLVG